MIELLDLNNDFDVPDNLIAFRVSGKVTETEMSRVLNIAREKIDQHGSITILEQIESFSGIELAAIAEEFRYMNELGMSGISKVAILTDKRWIEHIVSIEDWFFKDTQMRCFPVDSMMRAIEFLQEQAQPKSV
ncbi:MAG: STAS/SEC14 domain-containing protein [Marinobacterium sp.]|nr:STAS/SEC14 domain-containing protein [Marinobacterium sp.]